MFRGGSAAEREEAIYENQVLQDLPNSQYALPTQRVFLARRCRCLSKFQFYEYIIIIIYIYICIYIYMYIYIYITSTMPFL